MKHKTHGKPQRLPIPSSDSTLDALEEREEVIRALNDAFRKSFEGSEIHCTPGILALPFPTQERIVREIRHYRRFDPLSDPARLHNRGAFQADGHTIVWEIHCFNRDLTDESPDMASRSQSRRFLLLMLASESETDLRKFVRSLS